MAVMMDILLGLLPDNSFSWALTLAAVVSVLIPLAFYGFVRLLGAVLKNL
jgi:hypothetical protein